MGKKKGGGQSKYVVEYHLSFHLGFCHGPVDAIEAIYMKEKLAYQGTVSNVGQAVIDQPELYGGPEREGGPQGLVYFLPGHADQVMPGPLAAKYGLDPLNMPGYRHLCTLYFTGAGYNNQPGFKVHSNYPQVPPVWARIRRASVTLGQEFARIPNSFGRTDSNPIHMIHECLVDRVWGMGGSERGINIESFKKAAETIYYEGLGLTIQWARSTTIEGFVQEILDHINALYYYSPSTGLATIKLLRADYDPDDLDDIGPRDAKMVSFRRLLWGETVNELVVTWTNPETEQEETVTFQDLANIAMQGEVVSEPRHFYGVRSGELAAKLGARDMASAATPLATAVIKVNRRKYKWEPGDVVKLSWPKYEISNLLMRVMDIDYGKPGDREMRVTLLEDIFGLSYAQYLPPAPGEWDDGSRDPEPIDPKFIALPMSLIQNLPLMEVTDDEYPRTVVGILATPSEDQQLETRSFSLWSPGMLPTGETAWIEDGEKGVTSMTGLANDLPQEAMSTGVLIEKVIGGLGPQLGSLALIGDGDDSETELVMMAEEEGLNRWRIMRGVYDTVPRAWPAGTPIRFLNYSFTAWDHRERIADTDIEYKLLTKTSRRRLRLDEAPLEIANVVARPHFPYRPANVKVNGVAWGGDDWSDDTNPRRATFEVTWSNRHRMMEDAVARRWDDVAITPEDEQTTEIILMDKDGVEISRIVGLEGNSATVAIDDFGPRDEGRIKVVSRRDGLESLQGHELFVKFQPRGFGYDYGFGYGGWIGWEGIEGNGN